MRRAVSPPSTRNRNKNIRQVLHKHLLLLRREHQISITLLRMRKCAENSAVHAKVRSAHVRTFFHSLKTQRNPPEVLDRHRHSFVSFPVTPRRTWRPHV